MGLLGFLHRMGEEEGRGGEEEAGFYWKSDDLFFSPKESPREFKIQYISEL